MAIDASNTLRTDSLTPERSWNTPPFSLQLLGTDRGAVEHAVPGGAKGLSRLAARCGGVKCINRGISSQFLSVAFLSFLPNHTRPTMAIISDTTLASSARATL